MLARFLILSYFFLTVIACKNDTSIVSNDSRLSSSSNILTTISSSINFSSILFSSSSLNSLLSNNYSSDILLSETSFSSSSSKENNLLNLPRGFVGCEYINAEMFNPSDCNLDMESDTITVQHFYDSCSELSSKNLLAKYPNAIIELEYYSTNNRYARINPGSDSIVIKADSVYLYSHEVILSDSYYISRFVCAKTGDYEDKEIQIIHFFDMSQYNPPF